MPSVKLALDHVNEHSEILSNYRLHMWWNDTQVNAIVSGFLVSGKRIAHSSLCFLFAMFRVCSVMRPLASSPSST